MECLRDRIDREEREREQFAFNVANAGADVVGLAGSFVGAVDAYNNYKNLKNKHDKLQKELAEIEGEKEKNIKEKDNLIKTSAQRDRKFHQDTLFNAIYPMTKKVIRYAREEGTSLNIEQIKEIVANIIRESFEKAEVQQNDIDLVVHLTKETEAIQYIISNNACPSLEAFINNSAIVIVNNHEINYFYENYSVFFSMFTPKEITTGYPSNETFSWANEMQIKSIASNLIPYYEQRILLFGDKLKYFYEYQVNMLTPQQIQAIKEEGINFPQSSPIYKKIYQNYSTYGKGRDYSNQNVPKLEEDSNCCLLI